MTNKWMASLLTVVVMAMGSASAVLAHEGHDHKVMGTITMVAADHVMLKDTNGKDVTVKVTKDTKINAKSAMKVEDLLPGTRVVITASQAKDKSMTAKSIEVGTATRATK
jgi:hypothetical protein